MSCRSFNFRMAILPRAESRGILKLPREDGRKQELLALILTGGDRLRFLSFPVGMGSSGSSACLPAAQLRYAAVRLGR